MSGRTKLVLEIDYGNGDVRTYGSERPASDLSTEDVARMARAVILAAEFPVENVREIFDVE